MIATTADLAGDPAVIARAEAVRPDVAAASNDIETTRRLPPALLDKLHDAQLFRLLLPRSSHGIETDPVTFFHVIETIAKADASTAWCLSQAGGCAMSAAYLDLPVAQAIFGDPRAVLAWGPGPKVRAVECEGGYRVTGVWSFASGGRHATWLGAHCPIYAADGSPKFEANGAPLERTMLVRTEDVEWTDIWNTVGLRGTASDQFALNDFFVRVGSFDDPRIRPRMPRSAARSTAWAPAPATRSALPASPAASPAPRSIISSKRCATRCRAAPKASLRDNAVVQCNLAQAEVNLRAARGYVLQSMADTWKDLAAGATITVAQRINMRMASTNAIHKAREAVDFAYNAAGATAIFENHPLERRFRDMHTVTQQLQGQIRHFETVGAWMMGADADLTFV